MNFCTSCGTPRKPGQIFCTKCGGKTVQDNVVPNIITDNDKDLNYKNTIPAAANTVETHTESRAYVFPTSIKWVGSVIGVLFLLGAGWYGFNYSKINTSSSQSTSQNFGVAGDNQKKSEQKNIDQLKVQQTDSQMQQQTEKVAITTEQVDLNDYHWYKDTKKGLYIWNPSPFEGESVEWYGDGIYIQNSNAKLVNGLGKAVWYINGQFSQSDEGMYSLGKRNGNITQRFADGRVVVTEWVEGEKVR